MPVQYVQNNQAGPTVLSSDPKGTEYVEWQGNGDANGEDVQPVSETIQGTAGYQRAVRRGVLKELGSEVTPEIDEHWQRQQAAWDARQGHSQAVASAAIDVQANNDIITLPCVGPGQGPNGCPQTVNVRERTKDEKPPLCDKHSDLAPQYIPQQDIVGGRPAVTWTRVTMGARESAT